MNNIIDFAAAKQKRDEDAKFLEDALVALHRGCAIVSTVVEAMNRMGSPSAMDPDTREKMVEIYEMVSYFGPLYEAIFVKEDFEADDVVAMMNLQVDIIDKALAANLIEVAKNVEVPQEITEEEFDNMD